MTDETPQAVAPATPQETTLSVVERVEKATKTLEEVERRIDEKTKSYEQLIARQLLSGRSEAGTIHKTPEQLNAEKVQAEVDRVVKRFHPNKV